MFFLKIGKRVFSLNGPVAYCFVVWSAYVISAGVNRTLATETPSVAVISSRMAFRGNNAISILTELDSF